LAVTLVAVAALCGASMWCTIPTTTELAPRVVADVPNIAPDATR
jgi:hypothetical protein